MTLVVSLHNLGAARRGPEHGAPGGGGVVSWHVLLAGDHHSPGMSQSEGQSQ